MRSRFVERSSSWIRFKRPQCWSNPLIWIRDCYFATHAYPLYFLYPPLYRRGTSVKQLRSSSHLCRSTDIALRISVPSCSSGFRFGASDHRAKVQGSSGLRSARGSQSQSTAHILSSRDDDALPSPYSRLGAECPLATAEKTHKMSLTSYSKDHLDKYGLQTTSEETEKPQALNAVDEQWESSSPSDYCASLLRRPRSSGRRAIYAAHKSFVRKVLIERSKISFDWRLPVYHLKKAASKRAFPESEDVETIMISEASLAGLMSTLWDIRIRSGCQIEILGEVARNEGYRTLQLRGAQQTRALAREIISVASRTNEPANDGFRAPNITFARIKSNNLDAQGEKPPLRACWVASRHSTLPRRADRVERPTLWTTVAFANYVEDLVNCKMPRSVHHLLYNREERHVDVIAEILCELFRDPNKEDLISIRALNDALSFLYKFDMVHLARQLFVRAEELRIQMIPETFNLMLRGAAAAKDLHNFTFILRIMIKRSVQPNAATWIALVMTVETKEVKLSIMGTMQSMGLLQDRSTVKDLVAEVIPGEIIDYLQKGKGLRDFLDDVDQKYGPGWLSIESAKRILHDMGSYGFVAEACELFDIIRNKCVFSPDVTSFNILLAHCLHQQDFPTALRVLDIMESEWTIAPDQGTYDLIFKLGWNQHHYNFCRVAWHYGCMTGNVSYRMQKLSLQSLLHDVSAEAKMGGEVWRATAGELIVSNNTIGRRPRFVLVRPEPSSPAVRITFPCGVQSSRVEQKKRVRRLLKEDLMSVTSRRPLRPFSSFLRHAWVKDKVWFIEHKVAAKIDVCAMEIPWRAVEAWETLELHGTS